MKKTNETKKIIFLLYIILGVLIFNSIILLVKTDIIKSNSTKIEEKETSKNDNEDDSYDVSSFKSINPEKFMEFTSSNDTKVVYLGRSTCGYCVKFLPNLKKAQEELGYQTYYVDITKYDEDTKNYTEMVNLINDYKDTYNSKNNTNYEAIYGYTPLVVLLNKDGIKDISVGYSDYDTFKEFLNNNDIK